MGNRITGKAGKITVASVEVAQIHEWSLDASVDVVDVTAFQDTWHQKLTTFLGFTGTLTGRWTGDATFWTALVGAVPVTLALYLTAGGTTNWTGSAICNFSISVPFDGAVDFTASFEGTGTLSFTA